MGSDDAEPSPRVGLAVMILVPLIVAAAFGWYYTGVLANSEATPTETAAPETPDRSPARSTPDADPAYWNGTGSVNYNFSATCRNYTALSGEQIRDCHASIGVFDLGSDVLHIRVTAVTWAGDTETWIIYETPWPLLITEVDDAGTTYELGLGDYVYVEAVHRDGEREALLAHEFTCDDTFIGTCPYDDGQEGGGDRAVTTWTPPPTETESGADD